MHTTLPKKAFLLVSLFALVLHGCDLSVTVAPQTPPTALPTTTMIPAIAEPTQTEMPATLIPATITASATSTVTKPPFEGVEVSVDPLSIVLSPGLASGARGSQVGRVEGQDLPYWELTPGHTLLELEGYPLQGKFHEPQIYVFPALEYAQMVPGAFESMHRLNNFLYDPNAPNSEDQLPTIPFFNAAQIFASNIQVISFQNGRGVRFVTEYAQYAASANNHDLFYHFQGFSDDGIYYIIAILPISNPMLAETSDAGAPLPTGGVPYPYLADPNADMHAYYKSVTDLLNAAPSEVFTPTLDQLDQLIQSIRIRE